MKNQRIASDPKQRAARLNQPKTTMLEALRQCQKSVPLAPAGLRLLEELKRKERGQGE
jgi:hypothetical protein